MFFGGLLVVLGVVVVLGSSGITYSALKTELQKQLSTDSYRTLRKSQAHAMMEKAYLLAQTPHLVEYYSKVVSQLRDLARVNELEASASLALLREASFATETPWLMAEYPETAAGEQLRHKILQATWFDLNSLTVDSLDILGWNVGETSSFTFDMLVLADPEGNVLVEHLTGPAGQPPVLNNDQLARPHAQSLADTRLFQRLAQSGEVGRSGYLVYPDGHLYFVVTWAIVQADVVQGVLFIGKRMGERAEAEASGVTLGADVRILYGSPVTAVQDTDPLANDLIAYLADHEIPATGPEDPPVELALGDGTYLVRALALQEVEGGGEPAGWMFFMKTVQEIGAKADSVSRWLILSGLGCLVLCLALVPQVAKRFTRPIGALVTAMKRVGGGELEQIPESDIGGSLEIKQASNEFNRMVIGLRQKRVLEQFVPLGTREEVARTQGGEVRLGGERVSRTVLFSDLRGFTSMSEKLEPDEVMSVLNAYLMRMTDVIGAHGGDINEYIGDAILAIFADGDGESSASRAVRAAAEMNEALEELRSQAENEYIKGLRQGIGIHTGDLVEGNVGGEYGIQGKRFKRAVIGDTVNLAARIQDRSRDGRHTSILMSQSSRELLGEDFELELFGSESFKGKSEPVQVWELLKISRSALT